MLRSLLLYNHLVARVVCYRCVCVFASGRVLAVWECSHIQVPAQHKVRFQQLADRFRVNHKNKCSHIACNPSLNYEFLHVSICVRVSTYCKYRQFKIVLNPLLMNHLNYQLQTIRSLSRLLQPIATWGRSSLDASVNWQDLRNMGRGSAIIRLRTLVRIRLDLVAVLPPPS